MVSHSKRLGLHISDCPTIRPGLMLWDPTVGPADHSKRKPARVSCCLVIWRLNETQGYLQLYRCISVWLGHLALKCCEEQPRPKWKTSCNMLQLQLESVAYAHTKHPLPYLDASLVWRPLVLRVPVSLSRGCRAALVSAGLPILMDLKWCQCNPKPNHQVDWSMPSEAKAANSASRSLKTDQSHSKTCLHWGQVS